MRVREALVAGALSFSVFVGCASTSGGETCGISCAADGVCQTACAADPDCAFGGSDAATADAWIADDASWADVAEIRDAGTRTDDGSAPLTDADRGDAGGASADAATTRDAGDGLTCSAGLFGDGGACQACRLSRCDAPTCDDGTGAAATLGALSLDCRYRASVSNWATAFVYCAGLGSGWRLPTKGEALKIAASPTVCQTPVPDGWFTWTNTCAGAGLAWRVLNVSRDGALGGEAYENVVGYNTFTLCVR
jgi:hypothetical protein